MTTMEKICLMPLVRENHSSGLDGHLGIHKTFTRFTDELPLVFKRCTNTYHVYIDLSSNFWQLKCYHIGNYIRNSSSRVPVYKNVMRGS